MCMMRKLMGRAEWKYKLSLLSCSECPGGHHARGMAGKSLLFRNNKSFILVRWDQTTHLPSLLFCFSGWNIRALENKDHGKPRASFPLLAIASTHKCRDLVSPELHMSSVSDRSSCGSLLALNTLMLL